MTITIRDVYTAAAKEIDFKVDRALIERLAKFERDFANRNEDHIKFFGGNLVGVYPMKFRQQDRDTWFLEIVNLDEVDLVEAIRTVDYLDPSWKRPNDPFNLSCVWLMHEITSSRNITANDKQRGLQLVGLILMYRFMGSILDHYFPYPADRAAMEATMASLSRKYAIKTAGSWGKLFQLRAEELASTRSIHHKAYTQFNSDAAITYMINDVQGRLRELIKSIWPVFEKVRLSTKRIVTESSIMTFDGETVVKDKTRRFSSYMRYMQEVLPERKNFIREELTSVICDLMHTVPPRNLNEALEWMSVNHRVKGEEVVEELVDETLLHCFSLIQAHRATYGQNSAIEPLLVKLRALYTASRMSDPALLKMRDLADAVAAKSVRSKNASVLAGVRTAVQLYIVLRALAMDHYRASGGSAHAVRR